MKNAAVLLTTLVLASCASTSPQRPKAPEPAKTVNPASFYNGRWYEIGRTPMSLTDGCVAGYTDYQMRDGGLYERDACRDKTPDGEEKVIGGQLEILNPGQNTKVHVEYRVFLGLIPIHREYWMLDHTDEWFVMSTPDLKTVNLYTRNPNPAPTITEQLTKLITDKGYRGELEFPAQARTKR